jgi:hypothetical protein
LIRRLVDRGKIRSQGHVVEIRVRLDRSEWRVDQLAVAAGHRDVPLFKLPLQRAELAGRQPVSDPARSAVRQKRDLAILQAEDSRGFLGPGRVRDPDDLALPEVVASPVGTELRDLVLQAAKGRRVDVEVESLRQSIGGLVMADMERVLAMVRPFGRDAELAADCFRGAFHERLSADDFVDRPGLRRVTLASAGAGRDSFTNGVDERPADRLVDDRIRRQVELKQAHRALDVDSHRPGIDVCRRDHHAADGSAVPAVSVRVQD